MNWRSFAIPVAFLGFGFASFVEGLYFLSYHEAPRFWQSRGKPDPYSWDTLEVQVVQFSDSKGCKRERLREFDASQSRRWTMYYELYPDWPISPKSLFNNSFATIYVVKLYGDRKSMTRGTELADETLWLEYTKRVLTDELMWLTRPCEGETASQFYKTVYPNGVPRPESIQP